MKEIFGKFSQGEELMRVLLGTGDIEQCDASSKDRVWGIGFQEP